MGVAMAQRSCAATALPSFVCSWEAIVIILHHSIAKQWLMEEGCRARGCSTWNLILECRSVLPRGRGMLRQFGSGHSWFLNPGMSLCPRTGLLASMHFLVNNSNTQQAAAASFTPSNLWDDVDGRFYLLLLLMHLQSSCCELPTREATAWSWDVQQHHQQQGTGMPRSGTGRHWSPAVACVHWASLAAR